MGLTQEGRPGTKGSAGPAGWPGVTCTPTGAGSCPTGHCGLCPACPFNQLVWGKAPTQWSSQAQAGQVTLPVPRPPPRPLPGLPHPLPLEGALGEGFQGCGLSRRRNSTHSVQSQGHATSVEWPHGHRLHGFPPGPVSTTGSPGRRQLPTSSWPHGQPRLATHTADRASHSSRATAVLWTV